MSRSSPIVLKLPISVYFEVLPQSFNCFSEDLCFDRMVESQVLHFLPSNTGLFLSVDQIFCTSFLAFTAIF